MIRRRFALSLVALITFSACQASFAQDLEHVQMSDLIAAKRLPNFPEASTPNPDKLITPPGEIQYFPIRADGQPFVLNEDITVNWTDALNRYYYNPRWRGEVWSPLPHYWIVERSVRMMPTWPEYDQFSILRVGNGWHKFMERWSGFGP
jgi:hypothetical protein